MKKLISINYYCSTSSWKWWRWMRLNVKFSMRDIYINSSMNAPTKFSSSSRSTKFKDILAWSISQIVTKTIPISMRIVIRYAMKWGIPLCIWWEVNGNWNNNMIRTSQWRESLVEQILASEEINKFKRAFVKSTKIFIYLFNNHFFE